MLLQWYEKKDYNCFQKQMYERCISKKLSIFIKYIFKNIQTTNSKQKFTHEAAKKVGFDRQACLCTHC